MIPQVARDLGLMFILILMLSLPSNLSAQWSTSTLTGNALVINYGFQARVTTMGDGSSIFAHGLYNSVYLTKLDPRGYRVWGQQPIIAHYNDSSGNTGANAIVSDGAGGAIVEWADLRGATFDTNGVPQTSAIYVQHVDSSGSIRWPSDGVLVVPASGGWKWEWLVTDGVGGAVCVFMESSWGYPGALNRSRLGAARVNRNGEILWERTLDSSYSYDLPIFPTGAERGGRYIYIDGYRYYQPSNETYFTRIVDTSGVVPVHSPWLEYHENTVIGDTVLFSRTGDALVGNQEDTELLASCR